MSNIEVRFIIGLSGSGKSTYLRDIIRKTNFLEEKITVLVIDDFGSNMDRLCFNVIDDSETEHNIIFLCSHLFCKKNILDKSVNYIKEKYPNAKIEYTFFENNIQQACNNLFWRDKPHRVKELVKLNRSLSKVYSPRKPTQNVAIGDGIKVVKYKFKEKIKDINEDWDKVINNNDDSELENFVTYYSLLFEKLRSCLTIYS